MRIYRGTTAHTGTAFGIIRRIHTEINNATDEEKVFIDQDEKSLKGERFRFLRARVTVDRQLKELERKTFDELGPDEARVFEVTRMFLRDGSFIGEILDLIAFKHMNAESAVTTIGKRYYEEFASMEDEYMRARSEDIKEIKDMLVAALKKKEKNTDIKEPEEGAEGVIVLAETISAAEFMALDFRRVKGIVLTKGSPLSHAAIMARGRQVPMLVCCDIQDAEGKHCVMNANSGMVYVEPNPNILKEFSQKKLSDCFINSDSSYLLVKKNAKCRYFVNVGTNADIEKAVKYSAEGVGLYRSEFIYFGRPYPPTEDELFEIFKEALVRMGEKTVVIRTIDFGADKVPDYVDIPKNMRGIEFALHEKKMLKSELKALYRASIYGNLHIMFPMIRTVSEVREVNLLISEVKRELTKEGKDYRNNIKLGIMVETPEAVDNIKALSKEVQFFSIGTNDLSHLLLGISREEFANSKLSSSEKEKMLSAIKKVVDAGKEAGIHVSICGELATDQDWAEEFVSLGITSLSISI